MNLQKLLFVALLILSVTTAKSQIVSQGDKFLNLGLGIGNSFYSGSGYTTTIPPVSASFEVILNDDVFNDGKGALGVGGYAGFFGSKYEFNFMSSNYSWKYTNFVIGPRGYLHYNFLEKLDTYTGLMLGYNALSVSSPAGSNSFGYSAKASGLIWSWFVGGRYFFKDNLAAMVELGYGVAYLNVGVTLTL